MSSKCASPPISPTKKALEEKNEIVDLTNNSSSPAASSVAPKRARRISLETFFQPISKPKRSKHDVNGTAETNAASKEAGVVEVVETNAVDAAAKTATKTKVDDSSDAQTTPVVAEETPAACANSEQPDDDLMIVDEQQTTATEVEQTPDEGRTTPARPLSTQSSAGTSHGSTSPLLVTPGADQKTTPASARRRLTPAEKLEREREKERKRLEREAKQAERERLRQADLEEKERRRQEREQKRIEKEREAEEKRLEKEERERQRQEELRAKQEEKRKKEEEKRLAEERRKQEEDAKKREEETKTLKAQKQAITSFFKKVDPKPAQVSTIGPESSRFRPFQLKEGMRIASILRRSPMTDSERQSFDVIMSDQAYEGHVQYLTELRLKRTLVPRCPKPVVTKEDDDDVRIVSSPDAVGERMKAKLLQFHDNYRPPYYGTWRKKSGFVTGRRPFAREKLLDYEADSDEEWEDEPEDAEDCNSDDDGEEGRSLDDDGKEEVDDDDDGFFVAHGYLSDGEGVSDEDEQCHDAETRRARLAAKAEAWKSDHQEAKERKSKKLQPFLIGPCWNHALLAPQLAAKLRPFKALRIGDGPLINSYNRPQPPTALPVVG